MQTLPNNAPPLRHMSHLIRLNRFESLKFHCTGSTWPVYRYPLLLLVVVVVVVAGVLLG